MTPENIEAVKAALAPIAEKIGNGAEFGWEILVWGQRAEGIATLVAFIIFAAVCSFTIKWSLKEKWTEHSDITLRGVIGVISIFFLIISIIFTPITYSTIKILAPEYTAIKFLLDLGKPAIETNTR